MDCKVCGCVAGVDDICGSCSAIERSNLELIAGIVATGHSAHCARRQVWGDGECDCSALGGPRAREAAAIVADLGGVATTVEVARRLGLSVQRTNGLLQRALSHRLVYLAAPAARSRPAGAGVKPGSLPALWSSQPLRETLLLLRARRSS